MDWFSQRITTALEALTAKRALVVGGIFAVATTVATLAPKISWGGQLDRLANTVYWACTGGAFLWLAFALYGESTSPRPDWGLALFLGAIIAVPLWLIGRAVRYVVSGR